MPRPRILIVGDSPPSDPLKDDYDLSFTKDPGRALEIAAGEPSIDLVLLDVKTGVDVVRRMKANEQTAATPVIVVSGRNDAKEQARAFEAGAADYLARPISAPLLLARVGAHIELQQSRDLLTSFALVDPLTGIGNRRRFQASLEQEWRRSQRNRQPLSVAIIDIDEFSKFNDFYGRAKGDDCLRTIAESLRGVTRRAGDLMARYGDDQFALILPESNGDAARSQLARLLASIRLLAIPNRKSTCSDRVTVTAAAVTLTASVLHDVTFTVDTAESLLKDAKQAGRNQAWHLDAATGAKERINA